MTLEQDRSAQDGRKPRTKEELEEMFRSPEFRAKMLDGFAQIERGEYVRYSIHDIMRQIRRLRFDE